jgi:hypothetical protein
MSRWLRVRRWLSARVRRRRAVRMTKGRPTQVRVSTAESRTRGSRRRAAMFWESRRKR